MQPEHKKYILGNIHKKSVKEIAADLNLKGKNIRKFLEKQKFQKKQIDTRVEPALDQKRLQTSDQKRNVFLSILLIIILGFAVYGNSFNGQLFWDDNLLVKNNEHIKSWSYISKIFTEDLGAGAGDKYAFYRPFQMVTYMMDYSLWKLDVKGYHLTNTLLHILAAVAVYWLVNIIFRENGLSLLTGIFFVVHPIHTEAVTYISGRADSLALLFMLLCFIFYIKSYSSKKSIGICVLILLSYTLALLSKENSLILPLLLLLYHYSFKKEVRVKNFLPVVSLAVIYVLLRITILKGLLANVTHTTTLSQRLPGFFVAITNYIKLLILPFNLHMEYGGELFPWGNFKAILGVVIVCAALIYAFRRKENDKLVFFSIAWFFITLLPVSNLYPINAYMAEHWLYLPSIGFFLIVAKALLSSYKTKNFRIVTIVLGISSLTFYSYLTIRQNVLWREPLSFFERTLKYAPHSLKVYYNLGLVNAAIGNNEKAVALLKKAIEIKADHAASHNNLGFIYSKINRKEEAVASYKKAIEIKDDYARAYYNLGNVYVDMDKKEEAIASYERAIEIEADFADVHNNLGVAYKAINRNEEAVDSFKKAIGVKSNYADAYNNLGIVYAAMNRKEEVVASYKRAIEIKPDFAKAHYNLGNTYVTMDKKEEAAASYKRAIEINPDYAFAYSNLAIIYFQREKYKLAIEYFKKAEELGFINPSLSEALKPYQENE